MAKIGLHTSTLRALTALDKHTSALSKLMERLSGGMRIQRAADDPAGLGVAQSVQSDARVYAQAVRNANDGISLLNVADSAITELQSIVSRLEELAAQAANGSVSDAQRLVLDTEAQALEDEYARIVSSTEYNDKQLLDGSLPSLTVQLGYSAGTYDLIDSSPVTMTATGGDGTFQAEVSYGIGMVVRDGASGDFDGDGNTDIIAVSQVFNTPQARLLRGNGDGTFSHDAIIAGSSGRDFYTVEVADFDGDGNLDFIAGAQQGTATNLSLFLGNGDGTFAADTLIAAGTSPGLIAIGDVDGDSELDLAVSALADRTANVLTGNGDGTFDSPVSHAVTGGGAGPRGIQLADIDGDNDLDIVLGTVDGTDHVSVFINDGSGTFGAEVTFNASGEVNDIAVVDVNGDSNLDIIATSEDTFEGVLVYLGNGDGTFAAESTFAGNTAGNVSGAFIKTSDLNGDGFEDIIRTATTAGVIDIFYSNGDGTFQAVTSLASTAQIRGMTVDDFTGDGVDDIVVFNTTQQTYGIHITNSEETTTLLAEGLTLPAIDLTSQASALTAVNTLSISRDTVSLYKAKVTAAQSALQFAHNGLQATTDQLNTAFSRIMDIDAAFELARFTRLQILQQTASAILAQSQLQHELVLELINGSFE